MTKYLSFTTAAGSELVAADAILYVKRSSATAITCYQKSSTLNVVLTGTVLTQAFVDLINEKLAVAAQTSWTNAVISVATPAGSAITGITVA